MGKRRPKVHVYDSALAQELPEHRRYAVSYEPIWQSIRLDLSWREYEDAAASLAKVDGYVNLGLTAEQLRRRTWRVFNLFCAIPHGQHSENFVRMIEKSSSSILIPAMDRYRDRLEEIGYPTEWDWNWARVNAQKMSQAEPEMLERIYKHLLQNRGNKARRWHGKPELWYFIDILEEVMSIERTN